MTEGDPTGELTHLDEHGNARMVDVTGKAVTVRRATARCVVRASATALDALRGDPDAVPFARAAGVQAAKQAAALIPLCHPMPLDDVEVTVELAADEVRVTATATVAHRTGVEMEALTACAVTALSLVAAAIDADPRTAITDLTLWHKSGGRSGTWRRDPRPA